MTILFFAHHKNGSISSDSLKALSAAQQFNLPITIFLAGDQAYDKDCALLQEASQLAGIERVLYSSNPAFAHYLAEPLSETLASLRDDYSLFITASDAIGKNIFPRLAALLDVMQISNIIEIIDNQTFKRPIFAGSAIATVRSEDAIKVITVQSAAFAKAKKGTNSAPIQALTAAQDKQLSTFVEEKRTSDDDVDLSTAKIVVSGGRGFPNAEDFSRLLTPLAKKLNAAIGASRAAVDAGYAPNKWQVGQTGKIIAPDLYIAIGVSGAMQHIAGMKDSKTIVAINKDPEAAIFRIADYAIIGDLFDVIPELEKAL